MSWGGMRRVPPRGHLLMPAGIPGFWEPIAVGDFNGDGISDIAWKHTVTGNVYIQLFTAGRILGGTGVLGNAIDKDFLCVGDFDANTRHELVFVPKTRPIAVQPVMWFPDATGLALTTTTNTPTFPSYYDVQVKQCRDNDGDGKAEIIFKNMYGATTPPVGLVAEDYLWCMNGAGVKAEAPGSTGTLRSVDNTWIQKAWGDFNADGKFDIWWKRDGPTQNLAGVGNFAPTGEQYIYGMSGNTIAPEGYSRTVADLNYKVIACGQLDGTGKWCILFQNENLGPPDAMYVYPIDLTIATPFVTANEGTMNGSAAYYGYKSIGVGNFNAAAGPHIDVLMWNRRLNTAKIATISFAFLGTGLANFTISAGVAVPTPP